jgi:transcriptional regulator with XRE-family HTH domain
MPEQDRDPAVHRRTLRNTLRQMRDSRGVTQSTVADAMSWSVSKQIRIEAGQHAITPSDLRALLDFYEVRDPQTVGSLVEMAKNCKRQSWLDPYKDVVSDVFITFAGYEGSAIRSSSFQPILVPGLLQTDEYAEEVLKVIRGSQEEDRIRRIVELRIARQERVFSRAGEIQLNYVIDESVIRRVVGGRQVMRQQVSNLIESGNRDGISIRILPFGVGVYRSMRVPFVVLEFPVHDQEAILYLEYPQGESLIREDGPPEDSATPTDRSAPTAPPTYLEIFAELWELTSDEGTAEILDDALRALTD